MNTDLETERRATSADFHEIAICYHKLDTRVAVLETRIDNQDHRLQTIEAKIEDVSKTTQTILDKLNEHVVREMDMQRKVLTWTITTMVSATIAGISVISKLLLFGQ